MILQTICAVALIAKILPPCAPPSNAAVGYIEGEYVNVAPTEVARVANEYVRRGDRLKAGDRIATLETTDAEIAVRNAEAALAQANADLANILYGRRPEEIAAIEADLKSAQVQQDDAQRTLNRRKDLNSRGFASQADLDSAQTAYDVAASRARSRRQSCARDEEILSARNKIGQAKAALDNARWRLEQRQLVAPAAGAVSDIIRRVGEVAGPSAPVVRPQASTRRRREFWDEIHRLAAGGLTVLVSTHYMDEAERCQRIGYISYGHMLATGTVDEVVRQSGLHTFVVRANPSADLMNALLDLTSVRQVAPFGATLHVVGLDRAKMAKEVGAYASQHGLSFEPGLTSLEDVFIHFMGVSSGAPQVRAA